MEPLLRGRSLGVVMVVNDTLQGFFRIEKPYQSGFLAVHGLGDPAAPNSDVWTGLTEERCIELVRAGLGVPDIPVAIDDVMEWQASADVADRYQEGRVILVGDSAHVMPPYGGYGGNTGIQDAQNLAWKLAAVLEGRAPESLLSTYAAERKVIAQDLIDFDKEWAEMMARPVDSWEDPSELERYYLATMEFPAGFMTRYAPSQITLDAEHQHLATGYPVGKRFKSAEVIRRADNRWRHLGHLHEADGRWRIYVFADAAAPALAGTPVADFAEWWAQDPASPRVRYTPGDGDDDAVFDTKVVYQTPYTDFDPSEVPLAFQPTKVPFGLRDTNQIFATGHGRDIHAERGISNDGAIVVVRPDMYVAGVLPLTARQELTEFFDRHMLEPEPATRAPFTTSIHDRIELRFATSAEHGVAD